MSIAKKQLEAAKVGGVIELGAEDVFVSAKSTLPNIQSQLTNLAAEYSLMLAEELKKKDATSSGELADSILPLEIQVNGQVFSVQIQTKAYASFIDEGVDGWAKSRGSRFKFKTKGVNPQGEMVKSVSEWLEREGKMATTKYRVLTRKGKSANDFKIQRATSTAYMIKRFGIKATHFWRDATSKFKGMIEKELGIAVKIDIINNIVK
jgi:hypothetical protein